jgi:hypothetical protein
MLARLGSRRTEMTRKIHILLLMLLLPAGLAAQQDPTERLSEVLPADVAEQVIAVVESARNQALPDQAVANLALEGVAKGRSGEEVLDAVETLVADLGVAQAAIQAAGRAPETGEVEAATAAMRMGVDREAISELAQSQPSGRSLAVPMLVLGSLTEQGMPPDQALAQVNARLGERADDAALVSQMPEMAPGLTQGGMPAQLGPALASGMAGFQVPVAGVNVPVGPPDNVGRPGDLPGRGNPGPPGDPGGNPIG